MKHYYKKNRQHSARIRRTLPRHARRRGAVSIEALLVFATFVIGSFIFFFLGQAALAAYFREGHFYLASPLF